MEKVGDGRAAATRGIAYWLGWHAGAVRKALVMLEEVDQDGQPVNSRDEIAENLRIVWERFMESGGEVAEQFADLDQLTWAGFAVEADGGEIQALRASFVGAQAALDQAESYWDEAAACGHPDAPRYVAEMYPFRIRQVTRQEWATILEDGTPVLDREG